MITISTTKLAVDLLMGEGETADNKYPHYALGYLTLAATPASRVAKAKYVWPVQCVRG
jgi:hypothetical protein